MTTKKKKRECRSCNDYPVVDGPCRCCELVDRDKTYKKVRWCPVCDVHLCEPCRANIPKRIIAFGLDFFASEKK